MSTAVEALKVALGAKPPVTDPGAAQAAVLAAGQTRVNGFRQWAAMSAIGERAITEGATYAQKLAAAQAELQLGPLGAYTVAASDTYADYLMAANTEFEALAAQVMAAAPAPSTPWPITTVDATNFATRVNLMENAGPDQAAQMIQEAIASGDQAFLFAAQVAMQAGGHRNIGWKSVPGGAAITSALLEQITSATASVESAAAAAAAEMTDDYRAAWRYLCGALLDAGGRIDSMQRQAGALVPLLQPLATTRVGFDPSTEITA